MSKQTKTRLNIGEKRLQRKQSGGQTRGGPYVVGVEILCPDRGLEPKLSRNVANTSVDITCGKHTTSQSKKRPSHRVNTLCFFSLHYQASAVETRYQKEDANR